VLIVMPAAFHSMSDEDLSGVVAYLRSEPAVHAAVRPRSMNALGLILLGAGVFDTSLQPPVRGVIPEVREDSTAQYGGYLINLMACRDCHGKDLLGAPSSSLAPHGPNLVALVAAHPSGVFSQALRGGIGSDGRRLDPLKMPWNVFSRLSDVETVALYRYLKSLGGSR
jgi:mono/diheme cytochrome c family protein